MNLRLKELRKKLGFKQSELASKLNLSTSAICDYERGRRRITERTIDDICLKFNVNKKWLEHGEGEIFNDFSDDPEFNNFSELTKDIIYKIQCLPEKDQELIKTMIDKIYENEIKKETD